MGVVIDLASRSARTGRRGRLARPAVLFDLASPRCYLAAERVERLLGEVDWIPVDAGALSDPRERSEAEASALRRQVERSAAALRLPLVWPDRFPGAVPAAMRAAAYAVEVDAAGPFVLAAFRLAFCGGFDLDHLEVLAVAAGAAGIPIGDCVEATLDPRWDVPPRAAADALRTAGAAQLPAIRIGARLFSGEGALPQAAALLSTRGAAC